jgi:hypothetical protein
MKKLTKNQIDKKFRKVIPLESNYFDYFENSNEIKLDGRFASDELREIARIMDEIGHGDKEVKRIKDLVVKGFKAKDIKVIFYKTREVDKYNYSFYLMKNGKEYDLYYAMDKDGKEAGKWWPKGEDMYSSPLTQFIPDGFAEACENIYEFMGKHEEALELFKECGFVITHGGEFEW